MLRNIGLALTIGVATAAVPVAATTNYNATLSGLQQTIKNDSGASGIGLATLSTDENIFMTKLSWKGLAGPAQAAHVHCCALPGDDAPVAFSLDPAAVETGSLFRSVDLTALST